MGRSSLSVFLLTLSAATTIVPLGVRWTVPDDYPLGVPRRAAYSATNGAVYLIDRHTPLVHVFDAEDGTAAFTFGQEGGGPGDFSGPLLDVVAFEDGRIGVISTHGGLDVFDADGTFLEKLITNGLGDAVRGVHAAGSLLLLDRTLSEEPTAACGERKSTYVIARWSRSSSWGAPLATHEFAYAPGMNHYVERQTLPVHGHDIGPDGRVYVALSWDYEIDVVALDGRRERWSDTSARPVPRTEEDLARLRDRLDAPSLCDMCPGFDFELDPSFPAISKLRAGDDGLLWVLPWSGAVELGGETWDMWRDRTRIRRVRFAFDVDYRVDRTIWLADDLVLLLRNVEEAFTTEPLEIALLAPMASTD